MNKIISFCLLLILCGSLYGQQKFSQLGPLLPSPNTYRTASGSPGHEYWQQKADYDLKITLDDENQRIYGEGTITYTNNAPDDLTYLWLQLDQNMRSKDSDTHRLKPGEFNEKMNSNILLGLQPEFDGGFKLDYVRDNKGNDLDYLVNKTMMKVNMDQPLRSGEKYSFKLKWWYNINDRMSIGGRSGYEYFEKDDNYLYTIAQFFPRMCVYDDVTGWQNKQFLGRGEFTLTFGDYLVEITVPADHLVAATGVLQNERDVLSSEQMKRLKRARKEFKQPVIVANQEEAIERESKRAQKTKTWIFKAENVRDFAFASSRKFIWDAMAHQSGDKIVMAMSMYPKEGNPLWEKYSTKAVAHTLKWYSHYTFDYPYPVAWSINAARIGMEYPMICFNYGRCEEDGTYSKRTKYGMIGVIIHEVGHNYFPMIVNSDERQWTWMDEGLNSYVQYLTEQQWERNYPSRRGPAHKIVDYMKGDKTKMAPIMTNSESIFQFGNNAYGKPATALNILRETVVGRDLFDAAFKEYSRRWMFKNPTPADFFRTIEDATAVDLDWFWRSWFYTTDHVDLSMSEIRHFVADPINPDKKYELVLEERSDMPSYITDIRNDSLENIYSDEDPSILDFYNTYDPDEPDNIDRKNYQNRIENMADDEINLAKSGQHYYEITFENIGGNPMPAIVQLVYDDGSTEDYRYPAEIWRYDNTTFKKIIQTDKIVKQFILDPYLETADVDRSNNYYPKKEEANRFQLYKERQMRRRFEGGENPMQRAKRAKEIKP
jgi:hypothetical protein